MSSQAQLSKIQKNIVIAGILSISIVSWFFLFIMDSNMSSMNMDIPKVEMNMDSKTEMKIITELNVLSKNKTLIIIAHSLNTIKNVDIIYELAAGRIKKNA